MYILEIENVSKVYGTFSALENISFKIDAGDFVGLLGVNGAGKTTLISAISGINHFSGTIKVAGYDVITQEKLAKLSLGVVPQEIAFDPFLNVYQTLKFQSGLYGVQKNKEWIYEIMERMYLSDKANVKTKALSGGMKRRLMVAQALVHKPQVLILDEPTAGVDVEIRKNLWDFIKELNKKGHTILLTSHYLDEVEELCHKIIMIDKGKLVTQKTKADFISANEQLPTIVEIETQDGKFSDNLQSMIVNRIDNTYQLRLENNDQLLFVLNCLNAIEAKILNLNLNKPNLEDVFISYLKR